VNRPPREGRLVHVQLDDSTAPLAGAWYPAANGGNGAALLHLHGKGGNFYSGPGLFIPGSDHAMEYAHLSLNMRCHDLGYTRYDVPMPDAHEGVMAVGGGMWERMADGCADVLAGARWLHQHGYPKVFLAGHSSGAYYALQACAEGHDGLAGVVLMSTVISHKRHLTSWFPDGQADAAIARAEELVAQGEGHRLLPTEGWYYAISAASLLERIAEPDGLYERMLAACEVPVMFAAGEQERRVPQWRALYDGMPLGASKEWLLLRGASHDYLGSEQELTESVLAFVRRWA
jgi:pimeloyl-ACP methyl ester carboxylesterase